MRQVDVALYQRFGLLLQKFLVEVEIFFLTRTGFPQLDQSAFACADRVIVGPRFIPAPQASRMRFDPRFAVVADIVIDDLFQTARHLMPPGSIDSPEPVGDDRDSLLV
jgi:hypothetical protein